MGVANKAIYKAMVDQAVKELQKKKQWKKSTARFRLCQIRIFYGGQELKLTLFFKRRKNKE